jgi:hypothetical protein
MSDLETVDLNGVGIKLETILASQKFLHGLALVTLELDHLAHLGVGDDGAIASCKLIVVVSHSCQVRDSRWRGEMITPTEFLLDNGENLLAAKLWRYTLNSGQGLASISLCFVSLLAEVALTILFGDVELKWLDAIQAQRSQV